jgi:molybdopterin converting factor small subunit
VKVRFYGNLADAIGRDLEVEPSESIAQLRRLLEVRHPAAASAIARSRAVIGDTLVDDDCKLGPSDKVEFLPPVSGG